MTAFFSVNWFSNSEIRFLRRSTYKPFSNVAGFTTFLGKLIFCIPMTWSSRMWNLFSIYSIRELNFLSISTDTFSSRFSNMLVVFSSKKIVLASVLSSSELSTCVSSTDIIASSTESVLTILYEILPLNIMDFTILAWTTSSITFSASSGLYS